MSVWLIILMMPVVASAFVLVAASRGVPAPAAVVALLPLVAVGLVGWLAVAAGGEVALLAGLLTATVLAAGLVKRAAARAR